MVENKKPFFGEVALRKRRRLLGKQKGFCNLASCCGPTVAGSASAGRVDMKLENRLAEVDVEPPPPTFNLSLVFPPRKLEVVQASASLPTDQRDWSCPVPGCGKGLPALTAPRRLKAIAHHCKTEHPGHTLGAPVVCLQEVCMSTREGRVCWLPNVATLLITPLALSVMTVGATENTMAGLPALFTAL